MTPDPNSQSMRALRVARERRVRHGELKRLLKAREVGVVDVLTDPAVENLFVWDVVQWQYRFKAQSAKRMFRALSIPMTVRCGNLTGPQLTRIYEYLNARTRGERREVVRREQERWAA